MSDTIETLADRLVQREVNACLSSLVSTLAAGYGTRGPMDRRTEARELERLCEQALELACPIPDYEEAAIQAGWAKGADGIWRKDGAADPFENDGARELCENAGLDPYDREVYEHWAVSPWLGEQLRAAGEKVDDDFAGMVVWARTTTGQAISADAVILDITRALHAG